MDSAHAVLRRCVLVVKAVRAPVIVSLETIPRPGLDVAHVRTPTSQKTCPRLSQNPSRLHLGFIHFLLHTPERPEKPLDYNKMVAILIRTGLHKPILIAT